MGKKGNGKIHCKTQDISRPGAQLCGPILWLCWPILVYLAGNVGPSWGQCGPILGQCCPILGQCCPILVTMLVHRLGAMLTHLQPQSPKNGKSGKSTKYNKLQDILKVGGRGGGPSLLRRGEKYRTARTRPGGPWLDVSAYARQPAGGPY